MTTQEKIQCKCGAIIDKDDSWCDKYCQECWEKHCDKEWWRMIELWKTYKSKYSRSEIVVVFILIYLFYLVWVLIFI